MNKYGLLGERLSHSYSPIIHNEIFKDFGIEASYELLECDKDELANYINRLKNKEFLGFNVTIPYKKEIIKYLDDISKEAKSIGSVNTVALIDGKAIGFNTDYYGFYNQMLHFSICCCNKKCFILGTGGASLAISRALKDLGGEVKFVSRTTKNENTVSYDDLYSLDIDIIVNTTPVGMFPKVDSCPIDKEIIAKAHVVVDIIFNPRQTMLLRHANSKMDGLYMLVGQAIKSEEIWQNKKYTHNIDELLKRIEVMINE